jgi:hypothetical protein
MKRRKGGIESAECQKEEEKVQDKGVKKVLLPNGGKCNSCIKNGFALTSFPFIRKPILRRL